MLFFILLYVIIVLFFFKPLYISICHFNTFCVIGNQFYNTFCRMFFCLKQIGKIYRIILADNTFFTYKALNRLINVRLIKLQKLFSFCFYILNITEDIAFFIHLF